MNLIIIIYLGIVFILSLIWIVYYIELRRILRSKSYRPSKIYPLKNYYIFKIIIKKEGNITKKNRYIKLAKLFLIFLRIDFITAIGSILLLIFYYYS